MSKSPLINAGAATLYIAGVVSLIFSFADKGPDPDGIIMPLTMLSLLTLSVLVLGYIFFFQLYFCVRFC